MNGNWRDNIRRVAPYVPGEQTMSPRAVKLNTNENPYPPAPEVLQVIRESNDEGLRKYPDPDCRQLIHALADYHGVKPSQVFVGVGSDDVLAMAFMTFFCGSQPVLFPDISYAFYEVWAEMLRIPYRKQPLDDGFRLKKEDYFQKNGGIVFPNPNAPTGLLEPVSAIEEIVAANPESVVIIDEAYIDFGGESVLSLVDKYDNLLVTRTYSKSRSLAGMRIGYAIGQEELISSMLDVRNSYNSYTMNQTALAAGTAALADESYFRETLSKIIRTREDAKERMRKLGFSAPVGGESFSNFLFLAHESVPAGLIFQKLREREIFVRYFNKPRIDNYLRITIGTPEQMEILYDNLREILKETEV